MRLIAAILAFALAGCYQVDADVSGLSASAGRQSFDGAGDAAGQVVTLDRTFTFDSGSSLATLVRAARIDSVTLSPVAGVASLDFLQSLTLTLHEPDGDVPLVELDGKMTAADGSVRIDVNRDIDPDLLAGSLTVDASVRFVAPASPWAMAIDAVLTVRGHADIKP